MRPLTLGSLLALCVTAPTLAQDSPYYQGQTVTIELELQEQIVKTDYTGKNPTVVMEPGRYTFVGTTKKDREFLTAASFADELRLLQEREDSGTFSYVPYSRVVGVRGSLRPSGGGAGLPMYPLSALQSVSARLELTDATFGSAGDVGIDAAKLEFAFTSKVGISESPTPFAGSVQQSAGQVSGALAPKYLSSAPALIIRDVKLSLDGSQAPQQLALDRFPASIAVKATPLLSQPAYFGLANGDLQVTPGTTYTMQMTRGAQDPQGVVRYQLSGFPDLADQDWEGREYHPESSSLTRASVLSDGSLFLVFAWGTSNGDAGWNHDYEVTLSPSQFATLMQGQRVQTPGSFTLHNGDQAKFKANIELQLGNGASGGSSSGSSGSGMIGGLSGN